MTEGRRQKANLQWNPLTFSGPQSGFASFPQRCERRAKAIRPLSRDSFFSRVKISRACHACLARSNGSENKSENSSENVVSVSLIFSLLFSLAAKIAAKMKAKIVAKITAKITAKNEAKSSEKKRKQNGKRKRSSENKSSRDNDVHSLRRSLL